MSDLPHTQARDIYGTVFRGGSAILLARVVGEDGRVLRPEDISNASYSVYELDAHDPDVRRPVTGHVDRPLTVGEVLSPHLRRDFPWDVDEVGYNFRHVLETVSTPCFPHAGRHYLVEVRFNPVRGQPILVRFRLWSI
ncbi:MAG: hypothetical protein NZ899_06520 [Thermoguttaceae bacterium]|nr:hypothetical protein [Thermoguttaceae bacterium]MDW8079184.1 hypothetical protein [Thermoguttaceae bacterium]